MTCQRCDGLFGKEVAFRVKSRAGMDIQMDLKVCAPCAEAAINIPLLEIFSLEHPQDEPGTTRAGTLH